MAFSRPLSELPDSARALHSSPVSQPRPSLLLPGWHRKVQGLAGPQLRLFTEELGPYARGIRLSQRQVARQIQCYAAPATSTLPLPAQAPAADESDTASLKPLPKNVENLADDPSLANPLQVRPCSVSHLYPDNGSVRTLIVLHAQHGLVPSQVPIIQCFMRAEARTAGHWLDGSHHGVRGGLGSRHCRSSF